MPGFHEPPESMREKNFGSTDLQQCGWCRYASGTHRYDYCISGQCRLQKSYGSKITWDMPCFFLTASQADIEAIIDNKVYQIREASQDITRKLEDCHFLGKLRDTAPMRPYLPKDRKHDHFNIGDSVMVWFASSKKWIPGEVKMGYRHHDGMVSYQLEGVGPQAANDHEFPYKGGFWGMGMAVPYIMLRQDWEWFRDNPVEYVRWCDKAYAQDFNGKSLAVAFI